MKLWTTPWISSQAQTPQGLAIIALKTGDQAPVNLNNPKSAKPRWLDYALAP
jgi:hypothetical protein